MTRFQKTWIASHLLGESTRAEVVVLSWEGFPRVIGDNSQDYCPQGWVWAEQQEGPLGGGVHGETSGREK